MCVYGDLQDNVFFCQQVAQALCRIDERTLFTLSSFAIHIDLDNLLQELASMMVKKMKPNVV